MADTTDTTPEVQEVQAETAESLSRETTTTVITEHLLTAIKLVRPAVKTKRTMLPMLGCILVEASSERQTLTLSATNLETGLVRTIPANVSDDWALCLPWSDLKSFVKLKKAMFDKICNLVYVDHGLNQPRACTIVFKTGSLLINGITADEFPVLPTAFVSPTLPKTSTTCFDFPAQATAAALRRVYQSCDQDEIPTRPALGGVCFKIAKGALSLYAADGHMGATDRVLLGQERYDDTHQFIMPYRSVTTLLGLLDMIDVETLPLQVNWFHDGVSTQALIAWPNTRFHTRLIDDRYPDLESSIPDPSYGMTFIANRHNLISALEVLLPKATAHIHMVGLMPIAAMADQPAHLAVQVREGVVKGRFFDRPLVADQTVQLETCHVAEPSGERRLVDERINGPLFPYGVNIDFLLTQLRSIDSELVNIAWQATFHPMKITPVEGTSRHVIMPMTIR